MKIVIATAVYYPMINGVAVFSHNLALGLVRRGHKVMVICPSQTGKNYTRMVDGVKMVYLKSVETKIYPDQIHETNNKRKIFGKEVKRPFYKHGFRVAVFPEREIKKALDEFQPDVAHVQVSDSIGLSVVSYAKRHNIPVVTTEHNQPEVITNQLGIPSPIRKVANVLLSNYFVSRQSKSDFVTMPTKQAVDNLILSRDEEFPVPVAVVSNGVDLSCFKPKQGGAEVFRRHGLKEGVPTVLYVGRVDSEKKVNVVVDAFMWVLAKVPEAQLVVVGDGTDRIPLMNKVKNYPNIHFLGRIVPPELYEVYRIGDVFVTASEIETQGIVLIEAAASGLPLVAVDAGAVGEICQDQKNGFLCKPGDVAEIAEAIVQILTDTKKREGFAKESARIAKEHDFETTLDKFINIYERVIKDKQVNAKAKIK